MERIKRGRRGANGRELDISDNDLLRKIIDSKTLELTPYMRKRFVELLPPDQAEIKKNRSQRQFSPDDFSDDDDAELRKSERLVDDLKIEELRELVTQIQNGATFFKLVGGVAANLAITTNFELWPYLSVGVLATFLYFIMDFYLKYITVKH